MVTFHTKQVCVSILSLYTSTQGQLTTSSYKSPWAGANHKRQTRSSVWVGFALMTQLTLSLLPHTSFTVKHTLPKTGITECIFVLFYGNPIIRNGMAAHFQMGLDMGSVSAMAFISSLFYKAHLCEVFLF